MRYMRWSWEQLQQCPDDYIPVIVELARKEAAEARHRNRGGRPGR